MSKIKTAAPWLRAPGVLALQIMSSVAATLILLWLTLGRRFADNWVEAATLGWTPHWPRLSLLAAASPAVQAHVAAVILALLSGVILMAGVKGTRAHRTLGWGWVVFMVVTAISSLFIRQANAGHFSWLHLFAGWTLLALPVAVTAARRHKVQLHARTMTGLFLGGLVVAGSFAFMPGRLMWSIFFGG